MSTANDIASAQTQGQIRRAVRARTIAGAPAAWLAGIVVLSAIVHGAIVARMPAPWILPDEVVYSELAKSIAQGDLPSIRGQAIFGWGEVYPTLIAPAWLLFEDPVRSYHAALLINALVMSLAAVPAYLLARMFVSKRLSILVAAMAVLVPSMAYTGVVMTENAFYPVFLLSVWLLARAVRRPTLGTQTAALLGLGLAAFTRIQGAALVGAYLGAITIFALTGAPSGRGAYLRKFAPSAAVALSAALAWLVVSVFAGDGESSLLGARSGTFRDLQLLEVPQWFAYLVAGLVLYVAVVPAAATTIVLCRGVSRRASERTRLFAAVALPTFAAMLGSVSFVSASLDVDGTENLNERYVFYVVPLAFLGLAVWVREGLPRPGRREWLVIAALCLSTVALPIGRLEYNANFQSVALLPWLGLPVSSPFLHALVALFVVVCCLLWTRARAPTIGRVWLLVTATMGLTFVAAHLSMSGSAESSASPTRGRSADWVDEAVPPGAEVPVVWVERRARAGSLDPLYPWVMVTEFFNRSVAEVFRVGPPTYYEDFLPTVAVDARPGDGTLVQQRGRPVRARYVLVSCRTPVDGEVIAAAPGRALLLVRTTGRLRLTEVDRCIGPSGGRGR